MPTILAMAASMSGLIRRFHQKPRWVALFNFTIKKHIPLLSWGVLIALAASLVIPVFAILLGRIFDAFTLLGGGKISSHDLIHRTAEGCVQLLIFGFAGWLCNGLYFSLFVAFGEFQVTEARRKLFDGMLRRDQEWFENQEAGAKAFLSTLQS